MNPLPSSPSLVPPSSPYPLGGGAPSARMLTVWAGAAYEPGDLVVTRSLSESDWDMIRAFVRNIEQNDLRLRFGGAIDFDDEDSLRRRFGVNPNRGEIAWLLDERSSIAGISHRVLVSQFEAEIALLIRSDLKRRGIGTRMLNSLIRRSTEERLQTLSAFILYENRAMLNLARKAGFVARATLGFNVELALALGRRGAH
jgi:acetyltransferase